VEYPTAFLGSFDPRFLELPQEVLITVMRHHQRYFPVVSEQGKLLPHFVAVRNGDDTGLDEVRDGNEQVLRARFKDAEYFFQTDRKVRLLERRPKLEKLVFHKNLGTIGQKVARLRKVVDYLAKACGYEKSVSKDDLRLVVSLAKSDLTTQMVYEFPDL